MPLFKGILYYENIMNGTSWTISNYFDEVNPNDVRTKADSFNDTYMAVCSNKVFLRGFRVTANPLPAPAIKVHVDFPVSSFATANGADANLTPLSTSYVLGRGSGSFGGGSAYWKFHGVADTFLAVATRSEWAISGALLVHQAACLLYFTQFRRVATDPTPAHPKRRSYPVVNPPVSWPVFTLEEPVYETKTGRSFSNPGLQRR